MPGPGLFGKLFDFNNDGKLNCFEEAAELQFLSELMGDSKKKEENDCSGDEDSEGDSASLL